MTFPVPRAQPLVGHLGRWGLEPLAVLEEGAALGPVFEMRLWRRVVVGYRPEWNRLVLRDLPTFRSRGSLSAMTPYLAGGIVLTDAPEHRERRHELNPHFHTRSLQALEWRLHEAVGRLLPVGPFDALAWSVRAVRVMINAAMFGGEVADDLLARFLAPLERPLPSPLLPRRRLFRSIDAEIGRAVAHPPQDTLAAAMAGMNGAVEELRIALAAGFDTSAHTLAWALWHLAGRQEWREPAALPAVLDETLRLYPAGWIGSRVTDRAVEVSGQEIPAGTMVLYSPYLTHRDPELWQDPLTFRPERFAEGRPAWGFLPFSAGERTCLGAHLARLMLTVALSPFCTGGLTRVSGESRVRAGITLAPASPLVLNRRFAP